MTQDIRTSRDALQRLIWESCDAECRQIESDIDEQIRDLVRQAHRAARKKVQAAIQHERQQERARFDRLRAELDTHDREHFLEATRHTLARGWRQLDDMLIALWQTHECRSQWARSLFERAEVKLPKVAWRIEHPSFLHEDLPTTWHEIIRRHTGHEPEWVGDPGIQAGLRIIAAGVHLDGTLSGLLADQQSIQARLLDHIERLMEGSESGAEPVNNEDNEHG